MDKDRISRAKREGPLSEEFVALVHAACDGELSDEEVIALESYLRDNAAAQDFYIRYLRLDAELSDHSHAQRAQNFVEAVERGRIPAKEVSPVRRGFTMLRMLTHPTPLSLSISAAVLGVVLTTMAFITSPFYWSVGVNNEIAVANAVVASLTGTQDATWAPNHALSHDEPLRAGQVLKLSEGMAEVTFENGVVVLLHGPCRFAIESAKRGRLESGRILATVPQPAIGFRVDSRMMSVIDLGTEFGLNVDEERAETHVFEGRIRAICRSGRGAEKTIELVAGEAAIASLQEDELVKLSSEPLQFLRAKLPNGEPLANASRDYRSVRFGKSTLAYEGGQGLPASRVGHWNYYSSATQNPGDPTADLTPLVYGPGGDAENIFYVGEQGSREMPAVSNVEIFRGPIDRPPAAGELAVHPSDRGREFVILRWTVPDDFSGDVQICARARLLGTATSSDGVTFAVFARGETLAAHRIAGGDNGGIYVAKSLSLRGGDSVDFVVGRNRSWSNDQTGLSISMFSKDEAVRSTKVSEGAAAYEQ